MNLVQCNCDCVYQKDGLCNLSCAAQAVNQSGTENGCLHFVARKQDKTSQPGMPVSSKK